MLVYRYRAFPEDLHGDAEGIKDLRVDGVFGEIRSIFSRICCMAVSERREQTSEPTCIQNPRSTRGLLPIRDIMRGLLWYLCGYNGREIGDGFMEGEIGDGSWIL
jgi:hypothetical protein